MEHMIYAISGYSIATLVARWAIMKALQNLDRISTATSDIEKKLIAISVRLEKLDQHDIVIQSLAEKVSYLEGKNERRYH